MKKKFKTNILSVFLVCLLTILFMALNTTKSYGMILPGDCDPNNPLHCTDGGTGGGDAFDNGLVLTNPITLTSTIDHYYSTNSNYLTYTGDAEYYKVYVRKSYANIELFLTVPSGVNYNLCLYNSSKVSVKCSTLGTGAKEYIQYKVYSGWNYIKVYSYYGGSSSSAYSLTIEGKGYSTSPIMNSSVYGVEWVYNYSESQHLSQYNTSHYTSYPEYTTFSTGGYEYLEKRAYLYNFTPAATDEIQSVMVNLIAYLNNEADLWQQLTDETINIITANGYRVELYYYTGYGLGFIFWAGVAARYINVFVECHDAKTAIEQINTFNDLLTLLKNNQSLALKVDTYFDSTVRGVERVIYEVVPKTSLSSINPSFYDPYTSNYAYGDIHYMVSSTDMISTLNLAWNIINYDFVPYYSPTSYNCYYNGSCSLIS